MYKIDREFKVEVLNLFSNKNLNSTCDYQQIESEV